MKKAEFNIRDKVIVTTRQKKAVKFVTEEQKKQGMGDVEKSEVITQLCMVVRKLYCTSKNIENGIDDVFYDGWYYHCDNGQAYFPGLEEDGRVVELRKATEKEIEMYN